MARLTVRSRNGSLAQIETTVRTQVATWVAQLPSAPDGQIQRVAERFAIIACAGEIATAEGLTGWSAHAAVDAAGEAFLEWYERRFGETRAAVDKVLATLMDFLAAEASRLQPVGTASAPGAKVTGWRDETRAYLPPETWSALYPGAQGTAAASALRDMQLLLPGDGNRLTRRAPRAIPGRPRLYTLSLDRIAAYKVV